MFLLLTRYHYWSDNITIYSSTMDPMGIQYLVDDVHGPLRNFPCPGLRVGSRRLREWEDQRYRNPNCDVVTRFL